MATFQELTPSGKRVWRHLQKDTPASQQRRESRVARIAKDANPAILRGYVGPAKRGSR